MTLNHDELEKLLALKKEEVIQQGDGELGKVEKLVHEFLQMKVPHGSEILDVACGSGILSCMLQQHGYGNIDALDEDWDVIDSLKEYNLYRNYIPRGVKGVRSTGLETSVYDVVITAGGFTKDAINPLDVTELIRILRPQGHLVWTMNSAQDERSTEFGLLLANLRSLEAAGKIAIMKHEPFLGYNAQAQDGTALVADKGEQHGGEFYLIKRLPGALPYFADRGVSSELKAQIADILKDTTEPENRIRFYDEWSEKYEDDLLNEVGNYNGHTKCVEAFLELGLNRYVSILDLACGTGLLGGEVVKHGYENLDGLDASLQMLVQARKKRIFKEHINAAVGGLGSLPLLDDVYDVVMSSNGFAPGQIYPEAIMEILRVLNPGGYLIFTMRDGLSETSPRFSLFDTVLQELVQSQKCEITMGPVKFDNFVLDHPGLFYMIRKSTNQHLAYTDTQA